MFPNSSRRSSTNLSDVSGVKVVCLVGLPVAVEWHSSRYFTRHTVPLVTLALVSMLSHAPWDCGSNFVRVGCVEMIKTTRAQIAVERDRPFTPILVDVALDQFMAKAVFCQFLVVGVYGVEMVDPTRVPIAVEGNFLTGRRRWGRSSRWRRTSRWGRTTRCATPARPFSIIEGEGEEKHKNEYPLHTSILISYRSAKESSIATPTNTCGCIYIIFKLFVVHLARMHGC